MLTTTQKRPADPVADANARLRACMDATAACRAKLTPPLGDDELGQMRFMRLRPDLESAYRDAQLAEAEARKACREAQAADRAQLTVALRPGHQDRLDRIFAALDAAAAVMEPIIDEEAADALRFDGRLPWRSAVWGDLDRRDPNSRLNHVKGLLRGEGFRIR